MGGARARRGGRVLLLDDELAPALKSAMVGDPRGTRASSRSLAGGATLDTLEVGFGADERAHFGGLFGEEFDRGEATAVSGHVVIIGSATGRSDIYVNIPSL